MNADVNVPMDEATGKKNLAVNKGSRDLLSSTSSEENDGQNSLDRKRERRRNKIIQEILETEATYQKHLNLVVKYFEEPLKESKIIPGHVIVGIFSNIKQIININTELCQHLKVEPIGKAFLLIGPFLKLYSTYANNHERALATLMEWDQKCPEFSEFRRHQEETDQFGGLKLNALLITPVQRVPRYKLLLEDLLQHTDKGHEDYESLQEACRQIGAVAQHINEHIKQQDNFMKMLAVQKSLVGPLAPKILAPGRMFIKDGRLKKVSKNGGRSHERMFFLFSDILMYAKPKLLESGSLHSYNCCCIMPLHHCTVNRVFGHSQGTGALFTIQCKDESLLLYSDQETVDKWIKALTLAVGKFVENRQSLRKESSAKMPVRRGALAKYRKQQELLDPLSAARKTPPGSPFTNKTSTKSPKTPKTQKGFLKRTLKENEPQGSPSTPSPKKKQSQDAFMKTLWCLTPRNGRKKNKSEDEDYVDSLENTQPPVDVTSTPQVTSTQHATNTHHMTTTHHVTSTPQTTSTVPPLTSINDTTQNNDQANLTIGLDPSRIWKGGEDTTFMEQSTVISPADTSHNLMSPSCHSSMLEGTKTKRHFQEHGNQPSPINLAKAMKMSEKNATSGNLTAISENSVGDKTTQDNIEFAVGVSFEPILRGEHRAPSAGGISLSSNDFDREIVRSKPASNEFSDNLGISAISPSNLCYNKAKKTNRFESVFLQSESSSSEGESDLDTAENGKNRENGIGRKTTSVFRKRNNLHNYKNGSESSNPNQRDSPCSSGSDVANSSFSTSMGEFDRDSLRSLSRQYSYMIEGRRNDHTNISGQQEAVVEIDAHKNEFACDENRHVENIIFNDGTDVNINKEVVKRVRRIRNTNLEDGFSPIKHVNSTGHSHGSTCNYEPSCSSPMNAESKKNSENQCLNSVENIVSDFSGNQLNSVETMTQLKGWTTCYTSLKTLPTHSEEDFPDSMEGVPSECSSLSDNGNSNRKSGRKDTRKIDGSSEWQENEPDCDKTSSNDFSSSFSKALEAATYTSKVLCDTEKNPYGPSCVLQ